MSLSSLPQNFSLTYCKVVPCQGVGDHVFDSMLPLVYQVNFSGILSQNIVSTPEYYKKVANFYYLVDFPQNVNVLRYDHYDDIPAPVILQSNAKFSLIGQKLKVSVVDSAGISRVPFGVSITDNEGRRIFYSVYDCCPGKDIVYELPDIMGMDALVSQGAAGFNCELGQLSLNRSDERSLVESSDSVRDVEEDPGYRVYVNYTAYMRLEVVSV